MKKLSCMAIIVMLTASLCQSASKQSDILPMQLQVEHDKPWRTYSTSGGKGISTLKDKQVCALIDPMQKARLNVYLSECPRMAHCKEYCGESCLFPDVTFNIFPSEDDLSKYGTLNVFNNFSCGTIRDTLTDLDAHLHASAGAIRYLALANFKATISAPILRTDIFIAHNHLHFGGLKSLQEWKDAGLFPDEIQDKKDLAQVQSYYERPEFEDQAVLVIDLKTVCELMKKEW